MNLEPESDLWRMDCWTKDLLLSLCLSDGDLRFLGVWRPASCGAFPCERTRALARLHAELHSETALAHRVADLLDVRHVEAILDVSGAVAEELCGRFAKRAGLGSSTALLWALCTDSRSQVRLLGRTLLREELELAIATRRGSVRSAALGA